MTTTTLLRRLRVARATFGDAAERAKRELLEQIGGQRLSNARRLIAFHEDLLFLIAFPGAPSTRRLALQQLASFAPRWRGVPATVRRDADDSGIAGTVSRPSLGWPLVVLLVRDESIEIDWSAVTDKEAIDALIARVVPQSEQEAYESGHYGTRAWLALARARPHTETALRWLVRSAAILGPAAGFPAAWEAAEVPLHWSLGESLRTTTHARLSRPRAVWRSSMRRLNEPANHHIERLLPGIELLPARAARKMIDLARSALAARCREVYAMTYANPAEVHVANLGEGVELALIGVTPVHRLTLEANYGYLLLSNGVPIGYGGVTPLYRQANTGINIFDAFRGSEAAFIWAQVLRAFRTMFGVRRFVINGYQFGAGNSEAIRSGAYWFYYRLGFRPSQAGAAALAAREAKRLARPHAAPTSASVLRRLASGDLHLDLRDFRARDAFDEDVLPILGGAIARRIATLATTQREGERRLASEVAENLVLGTMRGWDRDERRAFDLLAPLIALTGPVRPADREGVIAWLRAKGAPVEREFALLSAQRSHLFSALGKVGRAELGRLNGSET